ncbi:MAG: hypothetical protein AAGD32_06655 [Planctomycetota bacterium]
MIPSQDLKIVPITPPGARVDNASFATTEIDTLGYNRVLIVVQLGATDVGMAALKVEAGDTSGSLSDVSALTYGTAINTDGDFSTTPQSVNDNALFAFDIDPAKVGRYLDLVAIAGNGSTGTYLSAFAVLFRADECPSTAADQGFDQVLRY